MTHVSQHSPLGGKALEFIKEAPRCSYDLCMAFGVSSSTAGRLISELIMAGKIIPIGKAHHAGRTDTYRDAPIYAVAGTKQLPGVRGSSQIRRDQRIERQPKAEGSGVIADRRQPTEFTELRRDPFEHMKLAMMTR